MKINELSDNQSDIKNVRLAEDIINEFSKAKKIMKLYPPNNPLYSVAIDALYNRFEKFFNKKNDTLTLYIDQYSLKFNNEQIYYNQARNDNFAFFFFKDGIRTLSFLNGLTKEEIQSFVHIINMDYETKALDDDIVTLFWNENYDHIKFIVDDNFITGSDISIKYEISDESIKNAHNEGLKTETAQNKIKILLEDADYQYMEKEILRHNQPKIHKIVLILVELLKHSRDPDYIDQIIGLIKGAISYCVAKGDFENACHILTFIKKSIDAEEDFQILDKIYVLINDQDFIDEIGSVLDNIMIIEESHFISFAKNFDHSAIPYFIELLGKMKHIKGRRLIIDALSIVGRHDIEILANGLNDSKWYVARNAALVLGKIGDPESIKFLSKVISHSDNRVRKEVVKALGNTKDNAALPLIKKSLRDSDAHVRIAAAKALGNIKTLDAKQALLNVLLNEAMSSKDFNEKKEFFGAIAAWNDKDVKDFLLDTLKKTSMWRKTSIDEGRACAAYALGIMRSVDSIDHLKKAADSKNTLLRKHSLDALKKIKS